MNPVPQPPLFAFPASLLLASVANPGHSGYNPPAPNVTPTVASFSLITLPPGGADDGSLLGLQPLEADIDAFRTLIDYRHYQRTKSTG